LYDVAVLTAAHNFKRIAIGIANVEKGRWIISAMNHAIDD
jgi:hypothetical protein